MRLLVATTILYHVIAGVVVSVIWLNGTVMGIYGIYFIVFVVWCGDVALVVLVVAWSRIVLVVWVVSNVVSNGVSDVVLCRSYRWNQYGWVQLV